MPYAARHPEMQYMQGLDGQLPPGAQTTTGADIVTGDFAHRHSPERQALWTVALFVFIEWLRTHPVLYRIALVLTVAAATFTVLYLIHAARTDPRNTPVRTG